MKRLPFACIFALFTLVSCSRELITEDSDETSRSIYGNPDYETTIGTNVQEFTEIVSSKGDQNRMKMSFRFFEWEPTGFFLPANTSLTLHVEQLEGTALPEIIIGTPARLRGINPKGYTSSVGTNTIPADSILGGAIWVRYTKANGEPSGKVRITFQTGHQRMPIFLKDITTAAQWSTQLDTCLAPEVLILGDRVINLYEKTRAQTYRTNGENFNQLIAAHDNYWDWQNELSGLDGSAPLHALPFNNRILVVATTGGGGQQNASGGRIAVNFETPKNRVFTSQVLTDKSWGLNHEMGHIHQQGWRWSTLGEVTNNVYALYVREKMGLPSYFSESWPGIIDYLEDTASDKNYNPDANGKVKEALFYQLALAYGWDFHKNLRKKYREESAVLSGDALKMRWFMLTACQVSGYNLTTFFEKYGFTTPEVPESVYNEIAALGLPNPPVEPSTITD